jgi:hypothetical protein
LLCSSSSSSWRRHLCTNLPITTRPINPSIRRPPILLSAYKNLETMPPTLAFFFPSLRRAHFPLPVSFSCSHGGHRRVRPCLDAATLLCSLPTTPASS